MNVLPHVKKYKFSRCPGSKAWLASLHHVALRSPAWMWAVLGRDGKGGLWNLRSAVYTDLVSSELP